MLRRSFLTLAMAGVCLANSPTWVAAGEASALVRAPPSLMLPNVYRPGVEVPDYWVSEKFDGVRGYWDGEALWTRGGEPVAAPAWFTASWPKMPMDGELWAGRGQFAKAVSTVRQKTPDDTAWRTMRFMVFDLPTHGGTFTERIPALNGLVSQIDQHWVQAVTQLRLANHRALQAMLNKTVKNGGEGLMLHRGTSLYKGKRSDDLLKLKTHEDAEARVIAHIPGKGKHKGKLGALLVEMTAPAGSAARRFKLGSGFTNAQRESPPMVGSLVTYRFRGLNDSGVPRFATFMRVREE